VARLASVRASAPVSPWPDLDAHAHAVFGDRILTPGVSESLPDIIHRSGSAGTGAAQEFFFGTIRNEHTRRAYLHAVKLFACMQGSWSTHVADQRSIIRNLQPERWGEEKATYTSRTHVAS
jgi:hypothetical protein